MAKRLAVHRPSAGVIPVLLTSLILSVSLAGCGDDEESDGSEAPATTISPTIDPTPTPTPDPTPTSVLTGRKTYVARMENDEGFKLRANITVYDAVRGSDTEAMDAAWAEVGGTVPNPCLDADVGNDTFTVTAIHTQTSAYAYGTLTITSETEGFDPPSVLWQFTTGRAAPKDGEWVGSQGKPKAMGIGFSDGGRCDGLNTGGFIVTPSMNDTTWGPVPIVFAYDGTFTPKHPNGDPSVLSDFPVNVADLGHQGKPGIAIQLADG